MLKMKYRIEIQPLAGRYAVALKDPATGNLVKALSVNGSAAEILRLFSDGMDISTIAKTLSEKYGVPAERVSADAKALIERLGLSYHSERHGE